MEAREHAGLTPTTAAERLGVTRATIYNHEAKGVRDEAKLEAYAGVYGVTAHELRYGGADRITVRKSHVDSHAVWRAAQTAQAAVQAMVGMLGQFLADLDGGPDVEEPGAPTAASKTDAAPAPRPAPRSATSRRPRSA
jgi:hypothetical protein